MLLELNTHVSHLGLKLGQQDCTHEFCQGLLDVLLMENEELKPKFEHSQRNIKVCLDCGHGSHGDDELWQHLPLDVQEKDKFIDLTKKTTPSVTVDDCRCSNCFNHDDVKLKHKNKKRFDQAEIFCPFTELPDCLFISFGDAHTHFPVNVLEHSDIGSHHCKLPGVFTEDSNVRQRHKCTGFISFKEMHDKKIKNCDPEKDDNLPGHCTAMICDPSVNNFVNCDDEKVTSVEHIEPSPRKRLRSGSWVAMSMRDSIDSPLLGLLGEVQ